MIDRIVDFLTDHLAAVFIIITIATIVFALALYKSGYRFKIHDFCTEKGGHWKTFDSSGFSMSGHYVMSDVNLCIKDGRIIEEVDNE